MRTKKSVVVLSVLGGLMLAVGAGIAPLGAHHSFSAEYDKDQKLTLHGPILRMEWVNPHSWLYITAAGPDGSKAEWAIEFGSPNQLFRRGWKRDMLPIGVEVRVNGYRARDGSRRINASDVILPDGSRLFAGVSAPDTPSER